MSFQFIYLIPLWLSLSVHEWAHAWTAWKFGDDTAKLQGRLTVNPLAHLDPIGTVLLPLLGVPFGWAKPVPVNPARFTTRIPMKWGMLWVAAAGPISNVLLAIVCVTLLAIVANFGPPDTNATIGLLTLFESMVLVNIALAVFNLLPIQPLDGGRIADALCPRSLRPLWEQFSRLGPIVLLIVIFMPELFGVNLFGGLMRQIFRLLDWVVSN